MALITFPRVFQNLTTALMSYLDDNFNAINTAFGAATGVSQTPAANQIPILDASGNYVQGTQPIARQLGSGAVQELANRGANNLVLAALVNNNLAINAYYDGTNWRYIQNSTAYLIQQTSTGLAMQSAAAGVAGNVITWGTAVPFITGPTSFPTTNNVIASRALGVNYQNTLGKPLFISVPLSINANGSGTLRLYVSATTPPTQVVWMRGNPNMSAADIYTVTGIVPNNYYYQVQSTIAATPITWWEIF